MKLTIEIECDNAAFDDDLAAEIDAVLDRVKRRFRKTYYSAPGYLIDGTCRDSNGNGCGFWKLEP